MYENDLVDNLPDHCSEYMVLDEEDRNNEHDGCYDGQGYKENNKIKDDDGKWICYDDREGNSFSSAQWKGAGYYRFMEPAGTILAEQAPGANHCGTNVTGWLNGNHPNDNGIEVDMSVCFQRDEFNCSREYKIRVTGCKGYYVYFLPNIIYGFGRYCGANPT